MKNIIKISQKMISMLLVLVMTATFLPLSSVFAEGNEKYPYTMFASSYEDGAITINAYNINVNGNICTNGTILTPSSNANINGTKQEKANESMIYIMEKLNNAYFSGSNVEKHEDDYVLEDMNININNPVEVSGEIELTGNINLSTGLKATDDISLNGEVENTNNSVIYSETGNIIIDTTNVNLNGLIYAPCGNIEITAQNLNMNNVILIAQKIIINCPSLNANYSSQMAEFVGTESEEISDPEDSDFELFAFAEYISENSSLNIFWETTVEQGIFEIFSSDDNVNFISEGTVTDAQEYIYSITTDFEKKYFKVSETTSNGKTVESVAFVVVKTEDGYEVQLLDSDEDGLPDIYEEMYGTDKYNPDTDEDGLTDYEEIYITGTDPLVYDSVTEGISDADADSDGDGISNRDEINFGTDPLNIDTDNDGLTDYDEIFVYGTDPLNPDSDEDGISDGDEIKIGLDPLNPETFGYPDIEYVSEQTISADSEVFDEVNTEESPYEVELEITAAGYAEGSLSATESSYGYAISNDCMLGESIELEYTCNVENIVLKYTIKEEYLDNVLGTYADCEEFQGIKRLNVFKYFDDINMLLPIETQFDVENNLLYAEVDELGTYCIMDMEMWFEVLGIEAAETVELNYDEQELQDFQIMSVYEELELEDIQDESFELQASASVSANSTYISGDFEYKINNGTACITKYTGTALNLEIPSVIDGYLVTDIGDRAFSSCANLISITIPNSVTNIGTRAFSTCTSLTNVTISNSVTSIGNRAFYNCTNLTNVIIPDSVTSIGEYAFSTCTSLTNVTIPNSVTNIGEYTFVNCVSLTSITIPDSVTNIEGGVFVSCESLTSVTIPDSVTSIGRSVFTNCSSLTSVTIPYSVTNIGGHAFRNCKNLISITIPDGITSIEDYTFAYFESLTSVAIPDSVTSIGSDAFSNCESLISVTIPDSVVYIGMYAFDSCESLTNVTIPDSVVYIGTHAFRSCKKLISINIPDSIVYIEGFTFAYCESLKNITIPDSVVYIGDHAFAYCENLTSVNIPNSVTYIGIDAFGYCSSLTNIIIPNSITTISDEAFRYCLNLKDVVIPHNITSIGRMAFYNCTNLKSITIPYNVTSIGQLVFYNCDKLAIYGYLGSYAERFAIYNNINFIIIDAPTEPFEALIGTKWKKIKLDGELSATNGIDTDSDTLTDWQEVNTDLLKWNADGSFELPTLLEIFDIAQIVQARRAFQRYGETSYALFLEENFAKIKVLPCISDPTEGDSDGDYYTDDIDKNKFKWEPMQVYDDILDDSNIMDGLYVGIRDNLYTDGWLARIPVDTADGSVEKNAFVFTRNNNNVQKNSFKITPEKLNNYAITISNINNNAYIDNLNEQTNFKITISYKSWNKTKYVELMESPKYDGLNRTLTYNFILDKNVEYTIDIVHANAQPDFSVAISQNNWVYAPNGGKWEVTQYSNSNTILNNLCYERMYMPSQRIVSTILELTDGAVCIQIDPTGDVESQLKAILRNTGMQVTDSELQGAIITITGAAATTATTIIAILVPEPASTATGLIKVGKFVIGLIANGCTYWGVPSAIQTLNAYMNQYAFERAFTEGNANVRSAKYAATGQKKAWDPWDSAPYINKISITNDIGVVNTDVSNQEIIEWCGWGFED